MGMLGGMMGGGVMALGQKLMAAGVPMGQMQPLGRELFAFGREKAGEDVMGPIVGFDPRPEPVRLRPVRLASLPRCLSRRRGEWERFGGYPWKGRRRTILARH